MKKKMISFLILHYKNIIQTVECVESILKNIKYKNYQIVIVDNGSNDNTGEELKRKYKKIKNICIIINKENLGFAKGNNIGFKFIKDNLKTDFIVMINSDTVIYQNNFCEKLIEIYNKYKFDVCGIDILLPNGIHSNPTIPSVFNVKDIKKTIKIMKKKIDICSLNLGIPYEVIDRFLKKMKKKRKINYNNIISNCIEEKVQLHGAALIFSRTYINKYDGLYNGTFLYFEEVSLRYIAERDNLKLMYIPDLKIIHKESQSTKFIIKDWKKRHIFYYKNVINSATNLLNYINTSTSNVWKEES